MTRALGAWLAAVLLCLAPGPDAAHAIVVTFEATDLADIAPGEDLWRYVYAISDFTPAPDVAVETLFDHPLYRSLQDPAPGVTGWDILTFQPDINLPDVGRYSALALSTGASLVEPFELTFVWLGGPGTAPGSQPFEVNSFDAQGGFLDTLATGFTTPATPPVTPSPVPLPATLALVLTGLLGFLRPRSTR
jgi:hypothetical protein